MSEEDVKTAILNVIMSKIEIVEESEPGAIRNEIRDIIEKDLEQGKTINDIVNETCDSQTKLKLIKDGVISPDATIKVEYPVKFISDTSDLRRNLPRMPLDGEPTTLKSMGIKVVLTPIDNNKISLSRNLTPFDLLVYMGVCSYIDSGIGDTEHEINNDRRFFTPMMIYKCINPTDRKDLTADSPEIQAVKESIEYMRGTRIYINYGNYTRNKELSTVRDGTFINADQVTITANGETMAAYILNTVPLMYWENKKRYRQLTSYDRKLLNAPMIKDLGSSNELSLLKHDILTHIQALKNGTSKLSKKISYDRLFERSGIVINDRAKKKRRRDQIKKYLDFLVQEGELKGYSEYKKGRTLEGIEFKI